MKESAASAARGWLHGALAAAAVAGALALVDGWLQPGNALPMLRLPVMAFSVLGAWALIALVLALALPFFRSRPPQPCTCMALGAFVGCGPLLFGWIPGQFDFLRIALAHITSLAIALLVFWKARPGLSLRWASAISAVAALVLLAGLLLARNLPNLRSAESDADLARVAQRGGRPDAPPGATDLVLISVDTLRADALVPDPARPGAPAAPVPFVQGLREREALWATYGLSSSDQTLPGHVGMLAGLDAMAHGVRHNGELPGLELRFLAQILREGGYRTAATISNGLIGATTAMDRGYDDFSEEPVEMALFGLTFAPWLDQHSWIGRCTPARWNGPLFARMFFRSAWARRDQPLGERTLSAATAQLAQLQRGAGPFFQFVHFMDPHTEYAPPPAWRGKLSAAAAAGVPEEFLPAPSAALHGAMLKKVEAALAGGGSGADAEAARRAAAYYHLVYLEEVMFTDACLARYVDAVRASGRPSVILLTADHGEMFGEHGLMEHANGLWEENLRVPFLIWGANVPPGRLGWVPHLEDVAPTLLTLAGLAMPPEMTGRALLVPADGSVPNGARAPSALAIAPALEREHDAAQKQEISVRHGAWKWTGGWGLPGEEPTTLRVSDLAHDPFENASAATLPDLLRGAMALLLPRDTWPQRKRVELGGAHAGLLGQLGYAGD